MLILFLSDSLRSYFIKQHKRYFNPAVLSIINEYLHRQGDRHLFMRFTTTSVTFPTQANAIAPHHSSTYNFLIFFSILSSSSIFFFFILFLFFLRTTEDVNVSDVSLVDFIGVKGKFAVYLPHTGGRYQVCTITYFQQTRVI